MRGADGKQRRSGKYDVLFEPVRIGPKTMRNRFYQTPHCTSLGVDAPGAQAELRAMKAEGGWAVVNTEACSIHPESDDKPLVTARLWDDDDVRNLSLMCARVHEHGSLAGVELYFGGPHATNYEARLAPRGVSQIADEGSLCGHSCYAMDKEEIRELQGFYVAAARRARSAGFDVVIIHGNVGSITQHFLMRRFNKRTDEYGGSFENRARFWCETLEQTRRRSATIARSRLACASTHSTVAMRGFVLTRRASHSSSLPTISSTSGTCRSARGGYLGGARTPHRRDLPTRTSRRLGCRRLGRIPASRSSASGVSPTRTRWWRSSVAVNKTSSELRVRRSPIRSCPRRSRRAESTTFASA